MLNNILPIFLTILLGNLLRKIKFINDDFITKTNKIVFYIFLPFLLFYKISNSDFKKIMNLNLIIIMYISFTILIIIAYYYLKFTKVHNKSIGSFLMNSFRGNYAYMGLPISYFTFGDQGLTIASIYMAFIVPIINLFSVTFLLVFSSKKKNLKKIIIETIFNPLAIACILGIIFSLLKINIPLIINRFLFINSAATLPLALLAIGASISLNKIKKSFNLALINTFFKLILLPLIGFMVLLIFKIKIGLNAQVMLILLATPAATVNFVLASNMDGDVELTSNTIIISTLLSFFTYLLLLYIFSKV